MADEQAEDPWSSLAAAQADMQAARQQLQLARCSRGSSGVQYSNTVFRPSGTPTLCGFCFAHGNTCFA